MNIVIAIILFILGLGLLISLHELGHFLMAKLFKVYCFEYSIGFGKKIIRRKSRNSETYFCIGIIPLGGYVSMYGEDAAEENKKDLKKDELNKLNNDILTNDNKNDELDNLFKETFDVKDLCKFKLFKKEQKILKKYKNDKNKVVEYLEKKYKKEFLFLKSIKFFELLDKKITLEEFFNNFSTINNSLKLTKIISKSKGNFNKAYEIFIKKYYGDFSYLKASRYDQYLLNKISIDELLIKEDEIISKVDEDNLPKYRSLENISKPKKIVVMSAGIIVNFILGYILYLIAAGCFPYNSITSRLNITDKSNIENGYLSGELNRLNEELNTEYAPYLNNEYFSFLTQEQKNNNPFFYIIQSFTSTSNKYILAYNIKIDDSYYCLAINNKFESYDKLSLDTQVYTETQISSSTITINNYMLYKYDESKEEFLGKTNIELSNKTYQEEVKEASFASDISSLNISNPDATASFRLIAAVYYEDNDYGFLPLRYLKDNASSLTDSDNIFDETKTEYKNELLSCKIFKNTSSSSSISLNVSLNHHSHWLGTKAFAQAGNDWANGTVVIFKSLGTLFTDVSSWNQVGGIVSILSQSATILENNPFSVYIQMWGLISVNLAILNLIPIPGLDGWHIVVSIYEGISKRKMNPKIKRVVETIGIVFLFALMAVVLIKDIVGLFI